MGYHGLAPGELSSGARVSRGSITNWQFACEAFAVGGGLELPFYGAYWQRGAPETASAAGGDSHDGLEGTTAAHTALCRPKCARLQVTRLALPLPESSLALSGRLASRHCKPAESESLIHALSIW